VVVVSTHTISLQEQLVQKDIPFLQEVMPQKLAPSWSKAIELLKPAPPASRRPKNVFLLTTEAAEDQFNRIEKWSRRTEDGSLSDLGFRPEPQFGTWWRAHNNCLGGNVRNMTSVFTSSAAEIHGADISS